MILTLFLSLALNARAEDPATLTFAAQIVKKAPYTLKFTAPKAHHFNLQAPANVSLTNGASMSTGNLKKDLQMVSADFADTKLEKSCTVIANLYVCNDANTYCRPVKQNFECETLALKK